MAKKKKGARKSQDAKRKATVGGKKSDRGLWALGFILIVVPILFWVRINTKTIPHQLTVGRQFLSRDSQVYVIPNFLCNETAVAWRATMQRLWNQTLDQLQTETCSANDDTSCRTADVFSYATNNQGGYSGSTNAKFRSLIDLDRRRSVARDMKDRNQFAYSKWELDPSHELVSDIQRSLTDELLLDKVTKIIRSDYPDARIDGSREMSDIFVTHYTEGDFLSPHNDGVSGTWAVVISLVEDDFDASIHGGGLQFECARKAQLQQHWCETLHPKFNTAVIFPTRIMGDGGRTLMGPMHEVLDVTRAGRYAITGWWQDVRDEVSGNYLLEREKMRARQRNSSP